MAELGEADEAELQRLVAAEQQKAQFTAQEHHFMELCWDKCVEKPGNHLESCTETCLSVWTVSLTLLLLSPVGLRRLYRKEGSKPSSGGMTQATKDLLSRMKGQCGKVVNPVSD